MSLPPGVNLIASITGDAGLGVTARNLALALQRHGVPFTIVDVRHPWGAQLRVEGIEAPFASSPADAVHPVNLYVLQLPMYAELPRLMPELARPGRMHAASIWWEATALPPDWVPALSRFDAVVAGSGFLVQVLANGLEATPVIHAPHPLAMPKVVSPARERLGLPPGATVFGASFDPHSDLARKNPVGAIRAFRAAFPPQVTDACLAVRVHHGATAVAAQALAEMRAASEGDPRVRFLAAPLGYEEVLAFYASCDAYVSLHRGEGLGLGMLESMALGKPVVATAWSGNMSFMDWTSACPVRYRIVRVEGRLAFLQPAFVGRLARWAEPMLEDAAAWMRRLHAQPSWRRELGARARAAFEAHQRRAWERGWIEELEAVRQAMRVLPPVPGKLSSAGTVT